MPEIEGASKPTRRTKSKSGVLEKFTPFLIVISIVLAFMVGILWEKVNYLTNSKKTAGSAGTQAQEAAVAAPQDGKLTDEQAKKILAVSDKDHILGSKDASVYLIEYSDLECPFCKQFHPTVQKIISGYKDKVAIVYRHFPLDQLHSKARKEAEAVECASELGGESAFWKMTDKIYEVTPANNGLDHSLLPDMAKGIGLDQTAWKNCWDSGKYKDKIEEQYQSGLSAGVTGTPTSFLINKKGEAWMIIGAQPYENFKTAIDEALKS